MSTKPPVGLFTPGWPGHNTPNGIATAVYFLAMGLREIGQTPVILTYYIDGPCPPDIPVIEIKEQPWRWQDRLRARFGDPDAGHRQIARSIASATKQAIKQHGLGSLVMEETNGWAGMVQPLVDVPVFITLHGPWTLLKAHASQGDPVADQQREARELKGFNAAAGLMAPSHNVMETVTKVAPLPHTPKIVLPNSFDAPVPAKLSATLKPLDILFIGRFDFLKGADTVIEAFERLLETHPEARITFAGPDKGLKGDDGSVIHMAEMRAEMPDRLRARFSYKGPVSREEVAQLRQSHAIALIASRFENLNYSLLEAMAAGQAIVSTNVGGPAEVLNDGETALLVPPGDPGAMAKALGRLLDDTHLAADLGQAARAKLTRDFAPTTIATKTVAFIEAAQ